MFLDSTYLIALIHERDQFHRRALYWQSIVEASRRSLLTTEFCLVEVADVLSNRGFGALAQALLSDLRNSPLVTIEKCSAALFDRGLMLHRERDDKKWGLTDCISFLVMEDYEVLEALTFDHHFEQAGKVALPLT